MCFSLAVRIYVELVMESISEVVSEEQRGPRELSM